jgi:hypothetical protein
MENERISVGQYLKNALQQSVQVFKTPKKLLPTIVIGIIWLVIGILSSTMKPFPLPLKIVSFLSYAEGGLFGGVLGAIGGIIGKVVVAVFINSLVLPLFEKKPPFAGVAGGIKGMFASMSTNSAKGVAPLLNGIGVALLLYTFMNINLCWQNSMVGIVALVMILQNIGNKGGFLFGLLSVMVSSRSKGNLPDYVSIMRFLSGMTIGFTLGVGLTFVGLRWCIWLALLFLLAGIILGRVAKTKQQNN